MEDPPIERRLIGRYERTSNGIFLSFISFSFQLILNPMDNIQYQSKPSYSWERNSEVIRSKTSTWISFSLNSLVGNCIMNCVSRYCQVSSSVFLRWVSWEWRKTLYRRSANSWAFARMVLAQAFFGKICCCSLLSALLLSTEYNPLIELKRDSANNFQWTHFKKQ